MTFSRLQTRYVVLFFFSIARLFAFRGLSAVRNQSRDGRAGTLLPVLENNCKGALKNAVTYLGEVGAVRGGAGEIVRSLTLPPANLR
jgi:hypothetical protein